MSTAGAHAGRLLGRCRLERLIGQGSMGDVYLAEHTTLQMPVAVKLIRPEISSGPEGWRFRERLAREARIAARLNHPGLVRVLDFGEEEGHPYLVMEYIQGTTLDAWLRERGPVHEHLALRIVGNLCTALQVAHQEGIIHRDLKPSNVLVAPDGRMKIADLGLARETTSAALTHPSGVAGTPHYIAPECLSENGQPDGRSDLYAVGVLFYRLLYGKLPFEGGVAQVLHAQVTRAPDWTLPEGVGASGGTLYLLRRLMEKSPDRRMPTAVSVVQACREQLARLEDQQRKAAEIQAQAKPSESAGSGLRHQVKERLSIRSKAGEIQVEHTSVRERLLVWGLALGLLLLALRACS